LLYYESMEFYRVCLITLYYLGKRELFPSFEEAVQAMKSKDRDDIDYSVYKTDPNTVPNTLQTVPSTCLSPNRRNITALSRLETKRVSNGISLSVMDQVSITQSQSNVKSASDILTPLHNKRAVNGDLQLHNSIHNHNHPSQSSQLVRPRSRQQSHSLDSLSYKQAKTNRIAPPSDYIHAPSNLSSPLRLSRQQRLQRLLDLPDSHSILSLYPRRNKNNNLVISRPNTVSSHFRGIMARDNADKGEIQSQYSVADSTEYDSSMSLDVEDMSDVEAKKR
jgi:hypothetical protein